MQPDILTFSVRRRYRINWFGNRSVTESEDQVQSLYDRQLVQVTDLYQVEATLAAAQAAQLQLEAEFALNRESLSSISGLEVALLFRLADDIELPILPFDQQYYVSQARKNNHRILAGEYAVKAAEQRISERKGAYLPAVSLIAQRQDADVGFDNLPIERRDNTYIGLNVSIPIYAGGRNKAGVSEAISRKSIAESELRATQLEAQQLVSSAYLRVQASAVQTNAAQTLVESTILASEAMRQGFELGAVASVEVLNALGIDLSREELQRIRYEHIRYLLLLKQAGTLTSEDVLEVGECKPQKWNNFFKDMTNILRITTGSASQKTGLSSLLSEQNSTYVWLTQRLLIKLIDIVLIG